MTIQRLVDIWTAFHREGRDALVPWPSLKNLERHPVRDSLVTSGETIAPESINLLTATICGIKTPTRGTLWHELGKLDEETTRPRLIRFLHTVTPDEAIQPLQNLLRLTNGRANMPDLLSVMTGWGVEDSEWHRDVGWSINRDYWMSQAEHHPTAANGGTGGVLSTSQVAERLQVTPARVRQLAGQLGGERTGRDWIFTEADIAAYQELERPKRGRPPKPAASTR
ncbi:hypothetical protein JCM15519_17040 [Fundidesulfovibrio butyratiphilus]